MKPFFSASDFETASNDGLILSSDACNIANALLKDHGKVVYGMANNIHYASAWSTQKIDADYIALLVCIEEIKRECEHKITIVINDIKDTDTEFQCYQCGKKLKPKWEVIE